MAFTVPKRDVVEFTLNTATELEVSFVSYFVPSRGDASQHVDDVLSVDVLAFAAACLFAILPSMADERRDEEFDPLRLPMTLTVRADFASDARVSERERPHSAYLPATALAIESMTARLFGDADRARHALRRRILDVHREVDPPIGTLPDSGEVRQALWELFEPGFHSGFVIEFVGLPLRAALDGRSESFALGFWAARRNPFPDLQFICVGVEFESGSLKSKLKLFGGGTAVVLTLAVGAAATPAGGEIFERFRVSQEISTVYGAERCMTTAELEVDSGALLDAMATEMNFQAPGLSPVQRTRAVCLVQLALDLSGYPVGPVDGVLGPMTQQQLHAFAKAQGCSGNITNPVVGRRLAEALHSGARELVKK